MMTNFEWLLKNHRNQLARVALIETVLKRCPTSDRELIEEMSLAARPIERSLFARQQGENSSTVAAAERLADARTTVDAQANAMQSELIRLKFYLELHDSLLLCFNDLQKRLIQLHFGQNISLSALERDGLLAELNGNYPISASSLKRLKRIIIIRGNALIEQYCPENLRPAP